MTTPAIRSSTWGGCALNGNHPPGSVYAKECPMRPGVAEARSARSRKAAATAAALAAAGRQRSVAGPAIPEPPPIAQAPQTDVVGGPE
jgi:hypothetical protein